MDRLIPCFVLPELFAVILFLQQALPSVQNFRRLMNPAENGRVQLISFADLLDSIIHARPFSVSRCRITRIQ